MELAQTIRAACKAAKALETKMYVGANAEHWKYTTELCEIKTDFYILCLPSGKTYIKSKSA